MKGYNMTIEHKNFVPSCHKNKNLIVQEQINVLKSSRRHGKLYHLSKYSGNLIYIIV